MYLTYYMHSVGIKQHDWLQECMEWESLKTKWRYNVPLKSWEPFTPWCGVISQQASILRNTTVRTSSHVYYLQIDRQHNVITQHKSSSLNNSHCSSLHISVSGQSHFSYTYTILTIYAKTGVICCTANIYDCRASWKNITDLVMSPSWNQ